MYQAMELSAYASLDLGDVATCERHVRALESVFPKSARVGRLLGCMLEAEGRHDDAIALYDDLLAQAPAEQRLMKRRVACLKAAGRVDEAIEALTSYLDTFMGDVAAWEEAAALFASRGDFARAVFCWEEVIVAQPQLGKHHRRIAETYYTWGGSENLRAARKYYAAALDMSTASDLRAMYGLVLVDKRLKDFEKTSRGAAAARAAGAVAAGDLGSELGKDAAAFLPRLYQAACPGLVPVVEKQMRSAAL
jgi:tetratricopeptide (TPR) repeat protein